MFGAFGSCQKFFIFLTFLILKIENHAFGVDHQKEPKDESIQNGQNPNARSPTVQVLVHIPSEFQNVDSLKNYLKIGTDRFSIERRLEKNIKENSRNVLASRKYEISRFKRTTDNPDEIFKRKKREVNQKNDEKPVPQQLVSSLTEAEFGKKYSNQDGVTLMTDAIGFRGPTYTTYAIKHFDDVDSDDVNHSKRRRNDSAEIKEDNLSRDKRTFVDGTNNGGASNGGGGGNNGGGKGESDRGDATTALPYWKRKKDNPQFITGRGSTPKGNDYSPPQHRSLDSARESHSMKNLEKTAQGNDIGRPNQDNYYSSTVRRTYNRLSDPMSSSTPKSVYDTIDYSNNKKNQDVGRTSEYRESRIFREPYGNRPRNFDYPGQDGWYQPQQPVPYEVAGRGVEYYHRSFEPSSGRIVYYADMPESKRYVDHRAPEPTNRNFYFQRPTPYDSYYMNQVSAYDHGYPNHVGRPFDHIRIDRNNYHQMQYYPYQERSNYQREPRYTGGNDRRNQTSNIVRNKTYIIYDADETRSPYGKVQYPTDINRMEFNSPYNNYQGPREPLRRFENFPTEYYSPSDHNTGNSFSRRQEVYPSPYPGPGSSWFFPNSEMQTNGKWHVQSMGNPNFRFLNSPDVQLPLSTTVNRNFHFRDSEKINKKS